MGAHIKNGQFKKALKEFQAYEKYTPERQVPFIPFLYVKLCLPC